MKTHMNFPTSDLDKSVAFYSTLLGTPPVKHFGDYALFVTDRPGLELALDRGSRVVDTGDAHYGISAESVDDVENAIARLERAGLVASIEREETCCYANQTKVWATDPDGRRWEVYTVHEETLERDDPERSCCTGELDAGGCCRT